MRTSFFFDLKRKNVMSFVGSRSRIVDLAWKTFFFSLEKVQYKFLILYIRFVHWLFIQVNSFQSILFSFFNSTDIFVQFFSGTSNLDQLIIPSFHSWLSIYIRIQKTSYWFLVSNQTLWKVMTFNLNHS